MSWLFCASVLFFTFATSERTLLDKLSKVKWQCGNENCSVPIGEGYGSRPYIADDPLKLNFNENDHFDILGKANYKSDKYWLVKAGDRKGIVPVQFAIERKILINQRDQVEAELDLISIIQSDVKGRTLKDAIQSNVKETTLKDAIQSDVKGRTLKDAIKPSSPSLVIAGTTFPPDEDYPISSEDGFEYFTEEENNEPLDFQEKKEGPIDKIKSDSPKTERNQIANNTEANEDFSRDKVVISADNRNEISNSQSSIENGSTENRSEQKSGLPIKASEDFPKGEPDTADNVLKNSNDQNFVGNSYSIGTNFTETNQSLAGGNKIEGTVDNVTDVNNKIEDNDKSKKGYNLEDEKNDESELTIIQNANTTKEISPQQEEHFHQPVSETENSIPDSVPGTDAHATVLPMYSSGSTFPDLPAASEKENSTTDSVVDTDTHATLVSTSSSTIPDQQSAIEKENSTASDLVPGTDPNAAVPLTKSSSSAIPDRQSAIEKKDSTASDSVQGTEAQAMLTKPKISNSELSVGSAEQAISHLESVPGIDKDSKPSIGMNSETATSANEDVIATQFQKGFETTPSDPEVGKDGTTGLPLGTSHPQVGPHYHPSASLPFSLVESVGKDKSSDSELPSTTPSMNQHNSDFNNVSSELSTSDFTSVPASDSTKEHDSHISQTNNYASSENVHNLKGTGDSESSPYMSTVNPDQEKPVRTMEEAYSTEPPVVDQHFSNQPHQDEVVTPTLPPDKSFNKEDIDGEDNLGFTSQTDELVDVIQEGDGWFSGISSIMSSFTEMFSKSEIGVDREDITTGSEEIDTTSEKSGIQQIDDVTTHCLKEPCSEQWKDDLVVDSESGGSESVTDMFGSFSGSQMSFSTFLCLVITSIVVLLFSLGYYYLENLKQDTSLISKINTVSSELFFAQKELASIEEQYRLANENYRRLVSETSHNETAIVKLRKELEESKAARGALEDEIKRLEKEIESLVEEGDEMHRMLAESFSEEERTKSLLGNISDLKSVLSERLQEIVSLTEQLDKEKQEVELLTISLKKSEEKRETTEDKLTKVIIDADSKTLAVTKEFEEKITTLERIIEERSLERTNFEKQICELNGTCESLMVEKELAEKELKKAHGVSSGKALSEWLETKSLRADLLTVQKKTEKLSEALAEATKQGNLLEEREQQLLSEIQELNNKYESAEKDKIEALTKLQVLSNYFNEKEIQLQEELGIKESQWLQKQSEDHTIYEQMRSLREENLSYKAQNDALKKEIIDQEASFKIQIANEEQKAQENWINLRHTERRLKEVQMEAAHLRSRLTALEVNPDALEDKHKSLEMVNGDVSMGAASPPFMLYPPPDFIPPPPLVSPTRPPPLGRLSSPPLTPPAPLSPYDFYAPPPPSPPLPMRVHKPQPREPHRKQKDSQSSNHSSESAEKPIRRGKR